MQHMRTNGSTLGVKTRCVPAAYLLQVSLLTSLHAAARDGPDAPNAPTYCTQCEKYLCECPAADIIEEPSSAQPGNDSKEPGIVKRGSAGSVEMRPLSLAQKTG